MAAVTAGFSAVTGSICLRENQRISTRINLEVSSSFDLIMTTSTRESEYVSVCEKRPGQAAVFAIPAKSEIFLCQMQPRQKNQDFLNG